MKTFVFEASQFIEKSQTEVFEFFSIAGNLNLITPRHLSFDILTPAHIKMQVGTIIDYRMKIYGIPVRWRTEISEWDPPNRFADNQVKGPYKKWYHTHSFQSRDNGTLMTDHVEYAVPGGFLAPLLNRLFVRRDVEKIFQYRNKKIIELFK